jgi:hypothetical protein
MKTYHITFVRNRESFVVELPLYYTATVRAKSAVEAHRKAREKLESDGLGGGVWAKSFADSEADYYRIVPVSDNRIALRRFFDSVEVGHVECVRSAMVEHDRRTTAKALTPHTIRVLLSGKGGKITRFRSGNRHGFTVQEARHNPRTGIVTFITHDLIARKVADYA